MTHPSPSTLLGMLRAYADLERLGGTASATALATGLGLSASVGCLARRRCIDLGLLDVVEPPYGNAPGRLRLTDAGRTALERGIDAVPSAPGPTQTRPRPAKAKAPPRGAPGAGTRRCLCCGQEFDSFGPGNRICRGCRSTEAYQSGDEGLPALVMSRR